MEHHQRVTVCAALCPVCGQPNQCARERPGTDARCGGSESLNCWCVTETFSPELLRQVPVGARGRACVCLACVLRSRPDETERSGFA